MTAARRYSPVAEGATQGVGSTDTLDGLTGGYSTEVEGLQPVDALAERERAGRAAVLALREALAALARVCVPENDNKRGV